MCGDCYAAEQWYEFGEEIEQLKAERDRIKADRAQADAEGHAYLDRARRAEAELARYKAFADEVLREASEYPPIGTARIAWAHNKHLGAS